MSEDEGGVAGGTASTTVTAGGGGGDRKRPAPIGSCPGLSGACYTAQVALGASLLTSSDDPPSSLNLLRLPLVVTAART